MTVFDLARYGEQAVWVAGVMLRILLVLGAAGLGVVVGLLPRFFQLRWIVFSPLAGLVAITLVSLPLALLGLPANQYGWPLLLVLAAVSGGSVLIAWRQASRPRRRRVALAFLRRTWRWLAVGFVIVVLLSTKMLTYGGNGRADGAWGSTDFGAYWIVAEYLQQHGANLASYEGQNQYHATDLDEHLRLHARLGCMTGIAVLGHAILPGRLPALLNPLIVTGLWLMSALVLVFARRERLWHATALLVTVFHPFLYFLLFYSYLCQTFSVLLIAAGLLIAEISNRQPEGDRQFRGAIAAGLFFAASILQYASAFIVPAIFLAGTLLWRWRSRGFASALICGTTVLVVAGYHLPRSFRELSWLSQLKVLPGWEWQRLVNVHDLFGLRSLITYEPLPAGDVLGTLVTTAISGLVGIALFHHLRKGALPLGAAALVVSTGGLAAYAWFKVWQGVPNATHGLAKVVSQYALFILMFAASGTVAAFPRQQRRTQGLVLTVIGAFAVIQLLQVANWRRAPWYDYDLITLVQRHRQSALSPAFDPGLDDRLVAPLIQDYRRLAAPDRPGPRLRFTLDSAPNVIRPGTLVDREGAYVALREP